MSQQFIGNAVVFIATVTVVFSDSVTMNVPNTNVKIGGNITIACQGYLSKSYLLGPAMVIHKKVLGAIYTVWDTGSMAAPYNTIARYSVLYEPKTFRYTLTIKNAQVEDSGIFTCEFKPPVQNGDVHEKNKTINVLHPPTQIRLTTTSRNGKVAARANEGVAVICQVSNYSPNAPSSARVLIGTEDVTNQFQNTTSQNVTTTAVGGGLAKVLYSTQLRADSFKIKPEYSGKTMKCSSAIGGDNPADGTNSVEIEVEGKATIDCPSVVIANLYDFGFNITCFVTSSVVTNNDLSFRWNRSSGMEEILTSQNTIGHYKLLTTSTAGRLHVTLDFTSRVQRQHFRDYTIVVKTPFGDSTKTVTLQSKNPLSVTDNGQAGLRLNNGCIVVLLATLFYITQLTRL